ncbi:hypothetical protein PENANT_c145G03629, partial [Penicillium antarcticum]
RAYQKVQRRRETLFKKAFEYSTQCDADVQLIVRIRKTGQIFTLTSKSEGWPLSESQLEINGIQDRYQVSQEHAVQVPETVLVFLGVHTLPGTYVIFPFPGQELKFLGVGWLDAGNENSHSRS